MAQRSSVIGALAIPSAVIATRRRRDRVGFHRHPAGRDTARRLTDSYVVLSATAYLATTETKLVAILFYLGAHPRLMGGNLDARCP